MSNSTRSSPQASAWSNWEWNDVKQCWYSWRIGPNGGTEWQQASAASETVPRNRPSIPSTLPKGGTAYTNIDENYTTDSNADEGLATSLATTTLDDSTPLHLEGSITSSHQERFNPNFKVHDARHFKRGKVFRVLWSEPAGSTRAGGTITTDIKQHKHGEPIYAKVRRFVVVDTRRGHCLCLPIMSYENRATLKPGVHPEEHAIIYTTDQPHCIKGEPATMGYPPIKVIPLSARHGLEPASRLNYFKVYTVEYNVKVWFTGEVDPRDTQTLIESYNHAHPPLQQTPHTQSYSTSSGGPQTPATDNTSRGYTYPVQPTNSSGASGYSNNPGYSNPTTYTSNSTYPAQSYGASGYTSNPVFPSTAGSLPYTVTNPNANYGSSSSQYSGQGYSTTSPGSGTQYPNRYPNNDYYPGQ